MRIKCLDCGHSEEVSLDLFVKIIGVAAPAGGFWAWTTFLFAGTGFALPIVVAIMAGGVAMLAFKDPIVEWIINKGYECTNCGGKNWEPTSDKVEKRLKTKDSEISDLQRKTEKYERELSSLKSGLGKHEKDILEFLNNQGSYFSFEDIEDLLSELEEKNNKIEALLKDKQEWKERKKSFYRAQEKVIEKLNKRFNALYPSIKFTEQSMARIARLDEMASLKLEQQLKIFQDKPKETSFRDKIIGTDVYEIDFDRSGRLYVRRGGGGFEVVCVGDKKSQKMDLQALKSKYKKS